MGAGSGDNGAGTGGEPRFQAGDEVWLVLKNPTGPALKKEYAKGPLLVGKGVVKESRSLNTFVRREKPRDG